MDRLLYLLAVALIKLLQALPLTAVARVGRAGGGLAYWLDARHRRVAMDNLARYFGGEKSPRALRALARENFRRIGENFGCAIKTAAMSWEALRPYCQFVGEEKLLRHGSGKQLPNLVMAIGHFGNFELYARFGQFIPAYQCATTYRSLRQPALDRLLQSLRVRSGCWFFERRTQAAALKSAMAGHGLILGFLADQHAGRSGARLPFLGRDCATTTAPAVFALRYHCPLHTSICYRVGLARWRIEAGDQIPTHHQGRPRPTEDITLDINRAFEKAVRQDPANWFWVHNRWKTSRGSPRSAAPGASSPDAPDDT